MLGLLLFNLHIVVISHNSQRILLLMFVKNALVNTQEKNSYCQSTAKAVIERITM